MNILPTGLNLGQLLQGALFPQSLDSALRTERAEKDREGLLRSPEVEPFPRGRGGARYLQAQMLSIEIEYQSTRLLQLDNGETVLERTRFQFRAVAAYLEAGRFEPESDETELERFLRSRFSPETVARRITDFALDRFDADRTDPAERTAFSNRAKNAVRTGVDQALRRLRGLPEEIRGLAEEIYRIVELLLDQFAEDGESVDEDEETPQFARPSALRGRVPEARLQFSEVSFGITVERTSVDLVA